MSKFVDSIIGHAVGDAMGVPIEFESRETLIKNPVTKMLGYGSYNVPEGTWSDDTSMTLATCDSIINKNGLDYKDIMMNFYYWLKDAKFTPNGEVFDAGKTCIQAIINFSKGYKLSECGQKDNMSNGNGSLMRILPIALYSWVKKLNDKEIIKITNDISSLTHAHEISKLGCYIYVRYVIYLLNGIDKEEAYNKIQNLDYSFYSDDTINEYYRLLKSNIKELELNDIKSTGYVVSTLEASFWVLLNTNKYSEAIIGAINLGEDTDTIGAIVGSMAGIIYGYNSIPNKWINTLQRKEYLIDLAIKFERTLCTFKKDVILGTAIGDIAGSRFEINDCKKKKNFILLHDKYCRFTDDTVMTFAVAKSLIKCNGDYTNLRKIAIDTMVEIGRKYIKCGFGPSFYRWLKSDTHEPYGSYGNGSAMRISAVPVIFNKPMEIKKIAAIITNVSHNHEDSLKGTEAVCMAINKALNNEPKEKIKKYIEENYFKLRNTLQELSDSPKKAIINCIETVKNSLVAFFESYDFEDAIRNAISIGGDSDTIGAITGGIAAAYYGIPEDIYNHSLNFLDDYLKNIHSEFINKYSN